MNSESMANRDVVRPLLCQLLPFWTTDRGVENALINFLLVARLDPGDQVSIEPDLSHSLLNAAPM